MPPYDEEMRKLIDIAQKARDEFDEAEKALREVDDEIRSIEKEISFDFGPNAQSTRKMASVISDATALVLQRGLQAMWG
ncbi:unnamed protein product [Knipowitschia caucasica]